MPRVKLRGQAGLPGKRGYGHPSHYWEAPEVRVALEIVAAYRQVAKRRRMQGQGGSRKAIQAVRVFRGEAPRTEKGWTSAIPEKV